MVQRSQDYIRIIVSNNACCCVKCPLLLAAGVKALNFLRPFALVDNDPNQEYTPFLLSSINSLSTGGTVKNFLLLFMILALCVGCATLALDVKPIGDDGENHKIVYAKNYIIGKPMTVYIGQSMIIWREGFVESGQKYIVFDDDFTFKFQYRPIPFPPRNCTIAGVKGFESNIQSIAEYNGKKYYIVEYENVDCPTFGLLIREDGTLKESLVAMGSRGYELDDVKLSPPTAHFTMYTKPNMHNGTTRELLFGGVNNDSINIAYREHSPDNLARQAFTQNLIYETKTETIRFRDFKIKVDEVSNEKIVFTVIDDGGLPSCDATLGLKCQAGF
jgi:hypothetical protein